MQEYTQRVQQKNQTKEELKHVDRLNIIIAIQLIHSQYLMNIINQNNAYLLYSVCLYGVSNVRCIIFINFIKRMSKIMHVRFVNIQIQHQNGIEQAYFSINYMDKQYFSSTFDHSSTKLNDDIILQLVGSKPPQKITLYRWQNCMIVFSFEIELSQLKNRAYTRKNLYTKFQELLSLQFQLYESKDIIFSDKYLENVSQHYMIIQQLFFTQQKSIARASKQPKYFTILTKNNNYVLPLRGSVIIIKLPDLLTINSFINNFFNGKSQCIQFDKIKSGDQITLDKQGRNTGKVTLKIRWAINLHRYQVDQNLLLQTNQLILYDLQLKFQNPADIVGCKFKIIHGSKAFEFAEDVDRNKVTKIKKVIFFYIKSQTQEVQFILTRGGKLFTHCRLNTAEIGSELLTIVKKKWVDMMNPNKVYGYIKAKGQRGRNLSLPQNNKYWGDALRRKQNTTNMMISIHQISLYYPSNESLVIVGKVDNEEKMINSLINLNFYEDQDEPSADSLEFGLKGEESLYMVVKPDFKSNDFYGIGVLNTNQLRLGLNVCQIGFFKNQQKAGTINCLINKMVFWPFPKPYFQNQTPIKSSQIQYIDVFLKQITFSPYFYTYRYDNKQQVYCIVQANKMKKVLILENAEHDQLSFFAAAGSDSLNYSVQQPDIIKIKLSFLISDLGHEEEIYGVAVCKIKGSELQSQDIKLQNIQILNDYAVALGTLSLEISKGVPPKVSPKQHNSNQAQKPSVGSFDLSQASFDTHLIHPSTGPSRRYSGGYLKTPKAVPHNFLKKNTHPGKQVLDVKLPIIKEKKDKETFKDLLQLMKVRKRGVGGLYEQKGKNYRKEDSEIRKQRHSFDLKKLQQSNPNIQRNLQILFPRKSNQRQLQMNRLKQNEYEDRLKGFKSVMNEIQDIGQVQPTIRQSYHGDRYQQQQLYQPEPQWEGNQFAHP